MVQTTWSTSNKRKGKALFPNGMLQLYTFGHNTLIKHKGITYHHRGNLLAVKYWNKIYHTDT